MTAHVVHTLAEFEALVPEWQALFLADPLATPFQHPAWLLPWARHLLEGDLLAVVLRDATGTLTGLLPAFRYRQPGSGRRDLLLLGAGTSDYLGGLFREPAAADLALATLLAQPAWDLADLHQLRAGSSLLAALARRNLTITEAEPCAVAATDPATRPAKLRLNVDRYRRRAQTRGGALRLATATTPAEALAHLNSLIDLHTRRWQTRGEPGVLANPAIQHQHRAAVPLLLAAGLLRSSALFFEAAGSPSTTSPIAVLYSLLDPPRTATAPPRRLYVYLVGIDPAFADLSPGTVLLAGAVEQCAAESIPLFDLLRGSETYKRLWGTHPQPTFASRLPPPASS